MPLAEDMRGFSPVARIARPISVDRNQVSSAAATAAMPRNMSGKAYLGCRPADSISLITVWVPISGTFGAPITRRLIEYSPTITRMPASR